MKFFTPELYLAFNSDKDDDADAADQAWEQALERYREHLKSLNVRSPAPLKVLQDLNLHDAELLANEPGFALATSLPIRAFVLSVRQDAVITSLIYDLVNGVQERASPKSWPFSKEQVHWLYDEIDSRRGSRGGFWHRILLSDGRVLEIPFTSIAIQRLTLPSANGSNGSRKAVKKSRLTPLRKPARDREARAIRP